LGDDVEARRLAGDELEQARTVGAPRALGIALRAAGLVAESSKQLELLRESAAALERSPAVLERARSLTELGAALRRANQRAAAREPLRSALDLALRCDAAPLADHARQELLASGAKPRRDMVTGRDALTPSERRVAEQAAEGLANREIAQVLFVSVRTVEMHLGRVYRKLGIKSRRELAAALRSEPESPEEAKAR
jgi:DNA-binding CsgD family transcriptional regulator